MDASSQPRGPRPALWIALLTAGVVALAGFLAYRPYLDLALLGLDTFPMILSGRVLGWPDFVGTFTEELMDGMYPDGHFYRPVANLSFALDYALWRLAPRGYHITDLVILIANGVLLSMLVRRLFGRTGALGALGALLAGLLFVLHPVQLEIQPVPPRRADTLCSLFLMACLLAQPRSGSTGAPGAPGVRRALPGALFALLAVGAKESGAIAVPLVFFFHLLRSSDPSSPGARLKTAALRTVPTFVALLFFVAVRSAVLGGLGGHDTSSVGAVLTAPTLVGPYLERLLYPQPIFGTDVTLGRGFVWTLAIALALSATALWRWPGTSVVAERTDVRSGLTFLALWSLCVLAISSLSGRVHDWYAMLFLAPFAALLGMLLDRAVALVRSGRPLPAVLPLVAATTASITVLAYSPLVRDYPMWHEASRIADGQIARYNRLLEQGRPGAGALFDRFVPWLAPAEDGSGIRSAFLHAEHSFFAYAGLVYPAQRVHVDFYRGGPMPKAPSDDVLHVVLYTGLASDLR